MANKVDDNTGLLPVSGVSDDDLQEVIGDYVSLPLTDEQDSERFIREVRRLADTRAQAKWPGEGTGEMSVFVQVERPRQVEGKMRKAGVSVTKVLDLRANDVLLFGRVFFLSTDASKGFFAPLPDEDHAVLDWLADRNLGSRPIAILWRQQCQLAVRKNGVTSPVEYEDVQTEQAAVTLVGLLGVLRRFHENNVRTPGTCKGIWAEGSARKYIPDSRPEKAIQSALRIVLNSWCLDVRAEPEDKTPAGRIDIRLLTPDRLTKRLGYWAIIELKVIRQWRKSASGVSPRSVSARENVAAMTGGLAQLDAYKSDRSAEEGLLEVYDLRRDKTQDLTGHQDFRRVRTKCDQSIVVTVRPLYGSAGDWQKARLN